MKNINAFLSPLNSTIVRYIKKIGLTRIIMPLASTFLPFQDHDDQDMRIENGLAVVRAWPDARFHATRGLGHARILCNPEVIQSGLGFITDQLSFPRQPQGEEQHPYLQPAPLY